MKIPMEVPGGQFTSNECNQITSELQNLITAGNIELSATNLSQVLLASQKLACLSSSCSVSGTTDSIELSLKSGVAINNYMPGMVFGFIALTTSTGPVTINVSQLGAVTLKSLSDKEISQGDILKNEYYQVLYDFSDNVGKFILLADTAASARYAILDHYPVGEQSFTPWFEGKTDRDGNIVHWEKPDTGTTGAMIVVASDHEGELNAPASIIPTGTLGTTNPMTPDNLIAHDHTVKNVMQGGGGDLAGQGNGYRIDNPSTETAGSENPTGIGFSNTKKLGAKYYIRVS